MCVGENYSANSDIQLGDKIIAINGKPASYWLKRTTDHISADTPYIAHSLLEFSFPIYLWIEIGALDKFQLTIQHQDQTNRVHTVAAKTRKEFELVAEKQSLGFTIDTNSRHNRMLNDSIAYLYPGPFYNFEDQASL